MSERQDEVRAKAFGWGALASVVGLPSRLVVGKLLALWVGPVGEGLIAILMAHGRLWTTPLNVGSGPALVSNLADALAQGDRERAGQVIRTGWSVSWLLLLLALLAALLAWWAGPHADEASPALVSLAVVAVALGILMRVPMQTLVSAQRMAPVGRGSAFMAVLTLVLTGIGIVVAGVHGYFLATALVALGGMLWFLMAVRRELPWFTMGLGADRGVLGDMGKVWLSQSSVTLAENAGLAAIYVALQGTEAATEAVGWFAAAWGLSRVNMNLLMKSIGMFVFPRYAAAQSSEEALDEIRAAVALMMQLLPGAFVAAAVLRTWIVVGLKSEAYLPAADLLALLLIGDLFRTVNHLHNSTLLYRKHLVAYSVLPVFQWGLFVGGTYLATPVWGVLGVGCAYVMSSALSLLPGVGAVWWTLGRPSLRFVPQVALVVSLVGLAAWSTDRWPLLMPVVLLAAVAHASRSDLARLVLGRIARRLRR